MDDVLKRVVEGFQVMTEHAKPAGITVLIESHGDFTRSADLEQILTRVASPQQDDARIDRIQPRAVAGRWLNTGARPADDDRIVIVLSPCTQSVPTPITTRRTTRP